ncbi:MAG: CopG family transcriptional regulator [bacterium]|nr:CopG family transcriptional regulator [bacterium]
MFRTQIYLTESEREGLKALSAQEGTSQSELIRQAIDRYLLEHQQKDWKGNLLALAGCLSEKEDWPDFQALRAEGDRELNW